MHAIPAAAAAADDVPIVFSLLAEEPAAYGWQLGDRVERVVHVQVPPGWRLDVRSLPRVDQRGGDIELRALQIELDGSAGERTDDGQARPATWLDGWLKAWLGRLHSRDAAGEGRALARAPGKSPGEVGQRVAAQERIQAAEMGQGPAAARRAEVGLGSAGGAAGQLLEGPAAELQTRADRVEAGGPDAGPTWPEALRRATRLRIHLSYQLFAGTRGQPRQVELPALRLLYEPVAVASAASAALAARELTLPGRPLWLTPLSAGAPAHLDGLGSWRPDAGVPRLSTAAAANRLAWWLGLAALALAGAGLASLWLSHSATAVAALPFGQAAADLRHLGVARRRGRGEPAPLGANDLAQAAMRRLHAAFDQVAGRTLLAPELPGWLAADGRFVAQIGEIQAFYLASGQLFYGATTSARGSTIATAAGAVGWPLERVQSLAAELARLELARPGPMPQGSASNMVGDGASAGGRS